MKRLLLALLAILLAPSAALAQQPDITLINGDLRPGLDLSGPWHWSVDPYRDGLAGFHGGEPGSSSRRYADVDPEEVARRDPRALFEQDMVHSPVVTLPGSWIGHDQSMRYYDGLVWYQRTFAADPKPGKRYFLRFGAVDYRAIVYLNGKKVGEHEGGFTPFALEVTGTLRPGRNQITVGADSERTWDTVPPIVTDWETYGGITRPVRLVETPQTLIDDSWIRLTKDGRLRATVKLSGANAGGQHVRIIVRQLGVAFEGVTDADGSWSGDVRAPSSLKRWSPEVPTLYDVSVEAGGDRIDDRIGFRTVEVRGTDILLNGKPIFLRGISMHEEELGTNPTRAMTPAAARALLSEIKNGLHGNFVRLAHYPHSDVMTRLADEMGLLVWSEIPVYWRVNFGRAETLALARKMQRENIVRDRNRASVVLWSVANETPVSPERNAFLNTLVADVRQLDDSRLVTAALLARRDEAGGTITQVIDDPLAASLDVMAVNTYNGWYSGDPLSVLPSINWASPVRKPLIFSEFGADAKAGFHDTDNQRKFSEEFQAEYYRQTLAMAAKVPFLRGMSPWILKDFRSPRRQHPEFQQGWNRKGLISESGQRKQAFDVLAGYYRQVGQPSR
ncbi:beta-glucuronidase [Sphingomonas piscis]|uniref:Beta-glucuronidase n=1 Tax=Sphingomonas piscis TaxID=2714943 RepID=A0A6G7YSC5_9SPHN|nr:glycoside hydrolase family 2 TIM barrel-domain containing protein [Sphingomonas piscis]QIK79648.1 beta-glucuronidase [Sphingomonas piscis]